jgi:hypothetical protein
LLLAGAPAARAIISLSAGPGGGGVIINTLLGADTFYNNGFFGQNSVIANVEAGAIWNGHETLTQVNTYIYDPTIIGTQLGQFDLHATAVGMALAGQGQFFYYQAGMAPLAQLWSASIATHFNPDFTFDITNQSFIYAYKQSMLIGRDVNYDLGGGISLTVHRTADVVNSSWGFDDPTGGAFEARVIDALVIASGTTFVAAAGNSGPHSNTVGAPASSYNGIAVAALAADTTDNPYTLPTDFSSRGPNDFFNPVTGRLTPGVRAAVDIAAPGEALALAYYGGNTGSNTGGVDPSNGANNFYLIDIAGTSFASPIVAGGAALLTDVAHAQFGPSGTDPRVIKAVLLNSADKTPGWNNGQALDRFGNTMYIRTTQGLDWAVGAGRMNLTRAWDQFTAGTTDNPLMPTPTLTGGHVQPIGWVLGHVGAGTPEDYLIDAPFAAGDTLTATLTWYVHRTFTDATADADATATDDRFANLNLQVWLAAADGTPLTEVAESATLYNNVEHLWLTLPEDGNYLLRVVYAGVLYDTNPSVDAQSEDFGLAWSNEPVPEPSCLAVVGVMAVFAMRRRRAGCLSSGHFSFT